MVVHAGLNTQPAYRLDIALMPRVCQWWWRQDRQLGFLRFLGFWLGDGHLNTEAGYSSVGVTQRKLKANAWLIDLLDAVFPRCWRRCVSKADDAGISYDYAIHCPPLVEWLSVMAAGPVGYNPLDPAQLRKYPHFDRVAWVEEQEAASPYRSPRLAGTCWSEAAMVAALGKGAVRRACCVCGDASGVRLFCSGSWLRSRRRHHSRSPSLRRQRGRRVRRAVALPRVQRGEGAVDSVARSISC